MNVESTDDRIQGRRILVIGGTGVVGAPIARALRDAGLQVRVMSRQAPSARETLPGMELVAGDANREDDVRHALTGCEAVLICVSDLLDPFLDLRVTESVTKLAGALGVQRIGLMSGASVAEERRYFPMIDAKFQAEKRLEMNPVSWVVFRPTWPMESLARFVQADRAAILGHQPAKIHPIAGNDLGRMVVRAFELPGAAGHKFTLHGPHPFTMREWLERYCALVRPGTRVKTVPFWVLSSVAMLTRNQQLKAVVAVMKYFEALPEYGDPSEANLMLGAPTTTTEQWVESLQRAASDRAA